MQEYTIRDNFTTVEGQQSVTTSLPFIDGTIEVYLNGLLQSFQEEYTTVPSDGTITFSTPIERDSVIVVVQNNISPLDLQVISNGRRDLANALYKKYNSKQTLKFNNRYTININIDDQDISWKFVTKMTPLFATVKKVVEDIGEFIQGFTDEYILSIIHRNSWDIVNRINEAIEANNTINAEIIQDATSGEYSTTYRAVSNYVRYKTEEDLIYARFFGISFNYGSISKNIGDITVEKNTRLPYLKDLLKNIKTKQEIAENSIFGSKASVGSFVKGSTSYEYSDRGTF